MSRHFEWPVVMAGMGWGALVGSLAPLVWVLAGALLGGGADLPIGAGDLALLLWATFWGATIGALAGMAGGAVLATLVGSPSEPVRFVRRTVLVMVPLSAALAVLVLILLFGPGAIPQAPQEFGSTVVGVVALSTLLMVRTARRIVSERAVAPAERTVAPA